MPKDRGRGEHSPARVEQPRRENPPRLSVESIPSALLPTRKQAVIALRIYTCDAIFGTSRRDRISAAKLESGPTLQQAAKPNNTLSQTLPAFGTRCHPRCCSRNFRRTSVVSSCRFITYSPSLPLSVSFRTVPPVAVSREIPQLDCSYCEIQRHCLSKATSHFGFP